MDYYDILNIPAGSTDQDIKRSYRKLAMKWHPDKNKSDEEVAREAFQNIAEAYDVLSDPEKRAIYDQYGYEGLRQGIQDGYGSEMRQGYAFNSANGEEIFNSFFGTANPFIDFGFGDTMPFASTLRKKGNEKCPPIELDLECSIEELYMLKLKKQTIERVRLSNHELIKEKKVLMIQIEPGWKAGTKITFEKDGNESLPEPQKLQHQIVGDVILTIKFLADPHYSIHEKTGELLYRAKIKLYDALSDCVVEVPTLDGRKLPITCNEVLSPKTEKVLSSEGLAVSKSKRGNLIIQFDIEFPKYLTELQKKGLGKLLR